VVVAVIGAGVVEVSIYDVVDVVAMRNRLMTARSAMLVICVMFVAIMRAARSFARIREDMLVYVVAMNMMKMSIMKVADVIVVLH
jgi:hypothetical protein